MDFSPKEDRKLPTDFSSLDVVDRKMHSNTYYIEEDGNYLTKLSSGPINYYDGSEFKPIVTDIVDSGCDFDYCVREGIYHADFKSNSDSNEIARFLYQNSYITYTPDSLEYVGNGQSEIISRVNKVTGSPNGNKFVYPEIYGEGFDLEYRYENSLLKENLIIEDKSDLPTPSTGLGSNPYLSLNFKIESKSLKKVLFFDIERDNEIYDSGRDIKWNKEDELEVKGKVELRDNDDNTRFFLKSAYAKDSNNNRISIDYLFQKRGQDLYVSVLTPYSWLQNAEYPVYIDPTTTTNVTARYVDNIEYEKYSSGNYIYNEDELNEIGGDFDEIHRGYIEFNGNDFQNNSNASTVLIDVDLWLYITDVNTGDCSGDASLRLHQLDGYSYDTTPDTQQEMEDLFDALDGSGETLYDTDSYDYTDSGWQELSLDSNNDLATDDFEEAHNTTNQKFWVGLRLSNNDEDEGAQGNSDGCEIDFGETSPLLPYLEITHTHCGIPNGSSQYCECDQNNDCPSGYICDNGPGYDACVVSSETCNGDISVFVEDYFGNDLNGSYVFLNGEQKGQTDEYGLDIEANNVTCNSDHSVQVRCSDNSTICDTKNVRIDGVTGEDYDSVTFLCDICTSRNDLFVVDSEIDLEEQSGQTNVSALIRTVNVEASNVDASLTKVCSGSHTSVEKTIGTVTSSNNYMVSALFDLSGCNEVRVHVDPDDEVSEDEEENNEGSKIITGPAQVYLNINTGFSGADSEISDYITENGVQSVSSGDASIEVYIGMKLADDLSDNNNLDNGWGVKNRMVYYEGLQEGFPYNGIVGKRDIGSKPRVYVFGNDIEGTLAGVRELVRNKKIWLDINLSNSNPNPTYLAEDNVDALYVYDYLHTEENQGKFKNSGFEDVVEKVLSSDTFNLDIKRVLTANADNVSLRLKHLNHELGEEFLEYTGGDRPVVMGHGLFGNLESMKELGGKIARDDKFGKQYIRNTWLMEYSGGPNTDCESCPNYDYDDLVDWYWPALIGGVLKYTGENQVDYVGYSAGGGLGIRSYEKYHQGNSSTMGYYVNGSNDFEEFNLPSGFVSHMALVAPMGAFNDSGLFGSTKFTSLVDAYGQAVLDRLSGKSHLSNKEIIAELVRECNSYEVICQLTSYIPDGDADISYNFFQSIVDQVQNKTDINPSLSSINRLLIIFNVLGGIDDDGVVPKTDIDEMYENSVANKKYKGATRAIGHIRLPDIYATYNPLLSKFLNNISYSTEDRLYYISEED